LLLYFHSHILGKKQQKQKHKNNDS